MNLPLIRYKKREWPIAVIRVFVFIMKSQDTL